MSSETLSRRIPENLGGTDTFFDNAPIVGAVEPKDAFLAFGPSILSLIFFESILPPALGLLSIFFSAILFFAGLLLLLAAPEYLTLSEWIRDIREFRNSPDTYRKALPEDTGEFDDGVESIEVNSDRDTRSKLLVDRIYPQYGAIERPDKTVVRIARIRGLNLDSAPQSKLDSMVRSFSNSVNQNLRDDIQLYMPMKQYDPKQQIKMYEERLENSRIIQNDPLMQEYIDDRISFLTAMSIGAYIRHFYVVVEVHKQEVLTKEAQAAKGKRLAERIFPGGLGELFGQLYVLWKGTSATNMSDEELKERQLEEVSDKLNRVMTIFGNVGCQTEPLNGDSVGVLLKEFWEGVHVSKEEERGFIRRNPYVKGQTERDKIEEQNLRDPDSFEPSFENEGDNE